MLKPWTLENVSPTQLSWLPALLLHKVLVICSVVLIMLAWGIVLELKCLTFVLLSEMRDVVVGELFFSQVDMIVYKLHANHAFVNSPS